MKTVSLNGSWTEQFAREEGKAYVSDYHRVNRESK